MSPVHPVPSPSPTFPIFFLGVVNYFFFMSASPPREVSSLPQIIIRFLFCCFIVLRFLFFPYGEVILSFPHNKLSPYEDPFFLLEMGVRCFFPDTFQENEPFSIAFLCS